MTIVYIVRFLFFLLSFEASQFFFAFRLAFLSELIHAGSFQMGIEVCRVHTKCWFPDVIVFI